MVGKVKFIENRKIIRKIVLIVTAVDLLTISSNGCIVVAYKI